MRNRIVQFATRTVAVIVLAAAAVLPIAAAPGASASTISSSCYLTRYDQYSQKWTGVRMDYTISNANTTGRHTITAKYANYQFDSRSQYAYISVRGQANAYSKSIWGTYSTITTINDGITITIKVSALRVNKETGASTRISYLCGTFNP